MNTSSLVLVTNQSTIKEKGEIRVWQYVGAGQTKYKVAKSKQEAIDIATEWAAGQPFTVNLR